MTKREMAEQIFILTCAAYADDSTGAPTAEQLARSTRILAEAFEKVWSEPQP
jgi:hypothetical protein